MASLEIVNGNGRELHVFTLNKTEAAALIANLVALLGQVNLPGFATGTVPSLDITEHGSLKYRVFIAINHKPIREDW